MEWTSTTSIRRGAAAVALVLMSGLLNTSTPRAGEAQQDPAASLKPESVEAKTALLHCHIDFTLSGWSAFYKKADGEGTITCDNGQSAKTRISTRGGGLTVGKSKILKGYGNFTEVSRLEDLFGSYANAEAHAGAGKSATAQVVTKGEISLALQGTGTGVDLGVSFGKFKLEKKS